MLDYQHLLQGKRVFISTGARGIGKDIALLFARHGAIIALGGRNAATLEKTIEEIRSISPESRSYLVDLSHGAQTEKAARSALEDFGGNSVLIRTFPLILAGTDIDSTIREIAAGFTGGNREVQSAKLDWIYHSSACRAAIKAGDTSRPAELLDLAKQVLLDDAIRYCPHGRPVCVEMTRRELEKQFGRIV